MPEQTKRRKLSWAERRQVYAKCGEHCAYCGAPLRYEDMQVDHVKSLRTGGPDTIDNMLPACRSCNYRKDTLDIENFRRSIEAFPRVLMRDSVTYKNAVRYGLVIPAPGPVKFYFEKLAEAASAEEEQRNAAPIYNIAIS